MLVAHNITTLILLRALQGFSCGSVGVLYRCLLNRKFDSQQSLVRAYSVIATSITITPLFSSLLGGDYPIIYHGEGLFPSMSQGRPTAEAKSPR